MGWFNHQLGSLIGKAFDAKPLPRLSLDVVGSFVLTWGDRILLAARSSGDQGDGAGWPGGGGWKNEVKFIEFL